MYRYVCLKEREINKKGEYMYICNNHLEISHKMCATNSDFII